jgi:lipid II:glycine glycyltransferase (peptidoglycan interpeptide bridge formation enzyme)
MGPLGEWLPDSLPGLEQISHQLGLFALKIEPDPRDTTATLARLRQSGFVASPHEIQPRRSLVVDLTGSEDDIMMEMHSKTRYNIRYSGRKGVEVKPSSEVAVFTKMMSATADRQEFGVHVPRYYQIAYDLFHPRGNCELFLAEYEGMPLAGLMVFARGSRSWYFYGASTTEERNRMPTYGLQWAAMRWAKERGCTSYDLWGVPDAPEEELEQNFTDRQDGLWGVYRFKRGFGGKLVRSVGAWDLRLNPWIYPPYRRLAGWLFR